MFYSLMHEAADGELSLTVRKLWEKRNGEDPVEDQVQTQIWRISLCVILLILLSAIGGLAVGKTLENVGMMVVAFASCFVAMDILIITFFYSAEKYMPKAKDSRRRFDDLYSEACRHLPQWRNIFGSEKELLEAAKAELKKMGWYFVEQEVVHGVYSKEKVETKKRFEEAYEVFKLLGWIEDMGWGAFTPPISMVIKAVEVVIVGPDPEWLEAPIGAAPKTPEAAAPEAAETPVPAPAPAPTT